MKTNYIYIMHDKKTDNFKVGISVDPLKRALVLPNDIDFNKSVCSIGEDSLIKNAEKGVHRTFFSKNINHDNKFDGHTEWFCGSILKDVTNYLSDYFKINDWVMFGDSEALKKEEITFREANKPETKTRYSYVIEFKDDSEEDQNIGITETGDDIDENIFNYTTFKDLWRWFYLKDSEIYNTTYKDGKSRIMKTVTRDEIKKIYGKIEDVTEPF